MTTLLAQTETVLKILSMAVKLVKPLIGIWLAWLIIHKINIKRGKRARQILMPVVAVTYCVISVIGGTVFFEKFDMSQKWNIFSVVVNSFLNKHNIKSLIPGFSGGEAVYLNITLLTFYAVVKGISKKIFNSCMNSVDRLEYFASGYYEFSTLHGEWFLQQRWRGFQKLMSVLAKVSIGVSAVILGYSWIYESENYVAFSAFPFILVLLFEEISNALDGYTETEYENSISGEDTVISSKIGAYQKIMPIYKNLFGSQLLSSNLGIDYSKKIGPTDYLAELAGSENPVDKLASHFFEQQRRAKFSLDVDCMSGTVKLLHGESVVFANPFYRDLSKYVLLPLVDTMIKGKKCVVLIGNRDLREDIVSWIAEMMTDYAKVGGIWKVDTLENRHPDCEVGILDFPSLYDTHVFSENEEFFREVSLCILVECSNMIPTGQVGLNMVVQQMNHQEQPPVYCIIDRTSDGLVDTYSHVLQTSITNVIAPPIPRCVYTAAIWGSEGDFQRQRLFEKETRFLGNGTELAAVAIKNQIPRVTWFGGRKTPVRDIEWITGQYYPLLTQYMHVSKQQNTIKDYLELQPNGWQAEQKEQQFIIVEDEFNNIFETLRLFLSRGENQSFVNVFADSYLLRDYMRYNKQMFMSDPKAIPSILPDYARTERNITLQLIIRMATEPVSEREIRHDLLLLDINPENVISELLGLIEKYTMVSDKVITMETKVTDPTSPTSDTEQYYSIKPGVFDRFFSSTIKNAYYVVEDEKLDRAYIDAKLYGLLTQCILPGQFIVSGGKYYQVEKINPRYGVLLRRASDRYTKRTFYRQIRKYYFEPGENAAEELSSRQVSDITVTMERRSFRALTEGYLDMKSYHDLRSAVVVDLAKDPTFETVSFDEDLDYRHAPARHPFERAYRNKSVLRITLPDSSACLKKTVAMLLQELFHTVYPENWQYIAVLSEKVNDLEGMLTYMTYEGINLPEGNDIFIVEDSELDLGLLESIDHNFMRFMEIITDYLCWHFEKVKDTPKQDPEVEMEMSEEEKAHAVVTAQKKRENKHLLSKIKDALGGVTEKRNKKKRKDKDLTEEETPENENPLKPEKDKDKDAKASEPVSEATEAVSGRIFVAGEQTEESEKKEKASEIPIEIPDWEKEEDKGGIPEFIGDDLLEKEKEDDLFIGDGMEDDLEHVPGLLPLPRTRYRRECFLKFGFDEIDERLVLEDVKNYLTFRGFSENSLTQARTRFAYKFGNLDVESDIYCDFCGRPLSGVSYEQLHDGRIRCNDCAATAIESVDEFRSLFEQHIALMKDYYRIMFNKPVSAQITDAKTIAKGAGAVFKPAKEPVSRVLGYAQKKGDHYNLYIENGSPRLATISTMIHEMTHIWQYISWDMKDILSLYGRREEVKLVVYEGMAVWSSIQYLYLIGETSYARMQEELMQARLREAIVASLYIYLKKHKLVITDPYPFGFLIYSMQYPLARDMEIPSKTPFASYPPLDDENIYELLLDIVIHPADYGIELNLE